MSDDRRLVAAAVSAHPGAAWAVAWQQALAARGAVGLGGRAAGLRYALSTEDWDPRLRGRDAVRQRIHTLAWLSELADHWAREPDQASAAWAAFAAGRVPLEDLEHVELAVVAAVVGSDPLPEAARVQLTWRSHAAAALAWAFGAFRDLEDASANAAGLGELLPALPLDRPRPVEELRAALDAARGEIGASAENSARRSVAIERAKALRWVTEPWWPELALTPWRPDDALSPQTPAGFEAAAVRARMAALAPSRGDASPRPASEVFATGVALLFASWFADAARTRDLVAATGLVSLRTAAGALPDVSPEGASPHIEDRVWLSAAADALFWATGLLPELPAGDPEGAEYATLIEQIRAGLLPVLAREAGTRPRADLEARHARLREQLAGARAGTMPHRFAAERIRALRWVLEPGWPSVEATPWDGTGRASPPPSAPLG